MYLLDTNILIYAYRNLGACRQRLDAQDPTHLHICPLTVSEIEYGIAKSSRPQALRLFLADTLTRYPLQALSPEASSHAGQLRATLERQGRTIGPYELLIAGIALAHNLTLVTRNTREFERLPGLRLENWYD